MLSSLVVLKAVAACASASRMLMTSSLFRSRQSRLVVDFLSFYHTHRARSGCSVLRLMPVFAMELAADQITGRMLEKHQQRGAIYACVSGSPLVLWYNGRATTFGDGCGTRSGDSAMLGIPRECPKWSECC
ncbi:hypothetical protein BDN72DRAFT_140344 [Pluteus cervinus]|uniref:Uncharacterized protein n=1 Tax=Pluteus cervinus TaxID=181527 RepID=A0ACD3ALG6_9AGAR|nr:hypothetical protein BDN72DRAFT_140344 [Pluteus cervinus]